MCQGQPLICFLPCETINLDSKHSLALVSKIINNIIIIALQLHERVDCFVDHTNISMLPRPGSVSGY
jgi:hypothetical protein